MFFKPEAQTVQFDQPDTESWEIWSQNLFSIVIWAPGQGKNMFAQVKAALADVDPNLVMYDVQPYYESDSGNLRPAEYDHQSHMAVWRSRSCIVCDWPLWRHGLWCGGTHERDRRAHGVGRRSRLGDWNGAARSVLAGRHRIGDRNTGGDWQLGISSLASFSRPRRGIRCCCQAPLHSLESRPSSPR